MTHATKLSFGQGNKSVVIAICVILAGYALATATGVLHLDELTGEHEGEQVVQEAPHVWSVLPFTLLLGSIAILPLWGHSAHWWEKNTHKFYVAANLALLTLAYLAFLHPQGSLGNAGQILVHTIVADYIPFIILLFSLYTISGGIRITGNLAAHPLTNSCFLAVGAVLASVIGTTGAAMLLIRPLLHTNRERKHVKHTVVMFIFIVCNCGGVLLPLGDPPLFLGYLNGVPFAWTLTLWKAWLLANGLLLTIYFLWDTFYFYPHEAKADITRDETHSRPLNFHGVWPNALLLVGVVLAVALLDSHQAIPGTTWHPWPYLREMVMLALVVVSLTLGSHTVRNDNNFDYVAIVEVACLFVGIFVCMQPALQILHIHGPSLGIDSPRKFFWASGSLSSVLDNAPTYLVFFQAAKSLPTDGPRIAGWPRRCCKASRWARSSWAR